MSTPSAIPVMKVTYPSDIALSMAVSKRGFISFSEYTHFAISVYIKLLRQISSKTRLFLCDLV